MLLYLFFANKSLDIVNADNNGSALEFIDQERYNLLYFFQLLGVSEAAEHKSKFFGIRAVSYLYDAKFLQYRFTTGELLGPTRGMVKYLELNCKRINESEYGKDCLVTYASLLLQLATFKEERGGISEACKLLDVHQYI